MAKWHAFVEKMYTTKHNSSCIFICMQYQLKCNSLYNTILFITIHSLIHCSACGYGLMGLATDVMWKSLSFHTHTHACMHTHTHTHTHTHSDTVSRCGVFCSFISTMECCKTEGIVDVFQVVKALCIQKPGSVATVVSMSVGCRKSFPSTVQ